MSNHKILFPCGSSDNVNLQAHAVKNNLIRVVIEQTSKEHGFNSQSVLLDKDTAIKLTRVLKAEISKIQ